MKPRFSNKQNTAAWTLVEVVTVIVVLLFVITIFLTLLTPAHDSRKWRIDCVGNLKQIGLAYRLWANDNNDKFPMQVSITNGGTMELANGRNAWINFPVMSNILSNLKFLICPQDTKQTPATSFSRGFNNNNVSYFVGLDANLDHPQMFLSGDDNFEIGGVPVKSGLLLLATNASANWTAARHVNQGNIGLADGSVQQLTANELQQAFQQTGVATNRLAIP
ncbi:MAG: type II secretion system protein [Verrucomicrobiota bacterium]|jgi:prepilin-type processing-associated H-X9-DG protein